MARADQLTINGCAREAARAAERTRSNKPASTSGQTVAPGESPGKRCP